MSVRILVVDDEAHILHVLSLKLRNAGSDVLTAGDGEGDGSVEVGHGAMLGRGGGGC